MLPMVLNEGSTPKPPSVEAVKRSLDAFLHRVRRLHGVCNSPEFRRQAAESWAIPKEWRSKSLSPGDLLQCFKVTFTPDAPMLRPEDRLGLVASIRKGHPSDLAVCFVAFARVFGARARLVCCSVDSATHGQACAGAERRRNTESRSVAAVNGAGRPLPDSVVQVTELGLNKDACQSFFNAASSQPSRRALSPPRWRSFVVGTTCNRERALYDRVGKLSAWPEVFDRRSRQWVAVDIIGSAIVENVAGEWPYHPGSMRWVCAAELNHDWRCNYLDVTSHYVCGMGWFRVHRERGPKELQRWWIEKLSQSAHQIDPPQDSLDGVPETMTRSSLDAYTTPAARVDAVVPDAGAVGQVVEAHRRYGKVYGQLTQVLVIGKPLHPPGLMVALPWEPPFRQYQVENIGEGTNPAPVRLAQIPPDVARELQTTPQEARAYKEFPAGWRFARSALEGAIQEFHAADGGSYPTAVAPPTKTDTAHRIEASAPPTQERPAGTERPLKRQAPEKLTLPRAAKRYQVTGSQHGAEDEGLCKAVATSTEDDRCGGHRLEEGRREARLDTTSPACASAHHDGSSAPESCTMSSKASVSTHQNGINLDVSSVAGVCPQQSSMVASDSSERMLVGQALPRQSGTVAAESSERSHMAGATTSQRDRWASGSSEKPLAASALSNQSDVQPSESSSRTPAESACVHQSSMCAPERSKASSEGGVSANLTSMSVPKAVEDSLVVSGSSHKTDVIVPEGSAAACQRDRGAPKKSESSLVAGASSHQSTTEGPEKSSKSSPTAGVAAHKSSMGAPERSERSLETSASAKRNDTARNADGSSVASVSSQAGMVVPEGSVAMCGSDMGEPEKSETSLVVGASSHQSSRDGPESCSQSSPTTGARAHKSSMSAQERSERSLETSASAEKNDSARNADGSLVACVSSQAGVVVPEGSVAACRIDKCEPKSSETSLVAGASSHQSITDGPESCSQPSPKACGTAHKSSMSAPERSDGTFEASVSANRTNMSVPGSVAVSLAVSGSSHQADTAAPEGSAATCQRDMGAPETSESSFVAGASSHQSNGGGPERCSRSSPTAGDTAHKSSMGAPERPDGSLDGIVSASRRDTPVPDNAKDSSVVSVSPHQADMVVPEGPVATCRSDMGEPEKSGRPVVAGADQSDVDGSDRVSNTWPTAGAAVNQSSMGAQEFSESSSAAGVCAHPNAAAVTKKFGKLQAVQPSPQARDMDAPESPLWSDPSDMIVPGSPLFSDPSDMDAPGSPKAGLRGSDATCAKAGLTGGDATCVGDAASPKRFKKSLMAHCTVPTVLDVVVDTAVPNEAVQTASSANEEKSSQLEMLRAQQARRRGLRKRRRIQFRTVSSSHDFGKRVEELSQWTRRRGHLPWAKSYDLEEKYLALWVKRIRTFKAVRLLSTAQQNQLDAVPGWSWKHSCGKDLRGKSAPRPDDVRRKAKTSAEQQEAQRKAREAEMKEQYTQLAQQRLAIHLARATEPEARRTLLRQWQRAFHPDKNPGREDEVRPLFEWVQLLWKRM